VLPAIKRIGPPDGDPTEIARKLIELHGKLHGEDNRRTFRRAFRAAAPALEMLAQIFARQSREVNRKTTRQDFRTLNTRASRRFTPPPSSRPTTT
jgi:hypothetical protein